MSTPDNSPAASDSGSPAKVPCPYPDCKGMVLPDRKFCALCRRPLARCPNGHVMAAELGFCDDCGYHAKTEEAEAQVSARFMLGPDALLELIADAYREAALASVNMRSATELLEVLRSALAAESNYHKAWDRLDEHIGRTLDKRLRQVLVGARERFVRQVIAGEVSRLSVALNGEQPDGWSEWLQTYAEALLNWRMPLAKALCATPLSFPVDVAPVVEKLRLSTQLVLGERWPETLAMYLYLSKQEAIPATSRARLLVVAGEIELYQLRRPDRAKKIFDEAQQLAPAEGRVIYGQGEYYLKKHGEYYLQKQKLEKSQKSDELQKVDELQKETLDKAREHARRLISELPQSSQGYVLMGDSYTQAEELDRAEELYQEAIRIAPGETGAYSSLLRLYGRPERLSTYESRLLPLREIASEIEPLNEYSLMIDMGTTYQQSTRYEEAHSWYDKAIRLNDRRLGGFISKGYAYLETEKLDLAREMFAKAIEVAPEALDGYWGMYYLYDQKRDWPKAIEVYEKSLQRRPELFEAMLDFDNADDPTTKTSDELKEQLIAALRAEPGNETIRESLTTLAYLYSKSAERIPAALDLYERLADALALDEQNSYAQQIGILLNAAGNIYFEQSKFQEAIEYYQKAITLDESNAVYHSNLSLGWENLGSDGSRAGNLEKAVAALERASQLNPNEANYANRLKTLQWELKFAVRYGEQAMSRIPLVTPLTCEMATDLIPFVATPEGTLSEELTVATESLRKRIAKSFGITVPTIRFRENSELPVGSYIIILREIPLVMGTISVGKRLFPGSAKQLADLNIPAESATDPSGNEASWVDEQHCDAIKAAGLETWSLMEYPVRHLEEVVKYNMSEFIGHQEVADLLAAKDGGPEVIADVEKLTAFTIVLRALVSEVVPISPLTQILSQFSQLLAEGKDLTKIVEGIRSLPDIRPTLPGNSDAYSLYRLGKRITEVLAHALRTENGSQFLAILPEECQEALAAVRNEISSPRNAALVVEQPELRPLVRRLTELEFPFVPVLSSAELHQDLTSRMVSEIELV